jgi:pimeloyl-ACP methyl ester carboxylesterase
MQELVSVLGGKFLTQVFREGRGDPLVFLHGELGHHNPQDSDFIKALSGRFTVYAPQHPGYGGSQGIEEIDDIHDMAFYYLDLLDTLALEQPFIVGHSMGGMIAAEMATLCPHIARRLVLVAPLGLWYDEFPIPDLFTITRDELRADLFSDPSSPMAFQSVPEEFASRDAEMSYWQGLSAGGKLLWGLPYDPKLAKRLHRITMPTLVVWGEDDRMVHPRYGDMFIGEIPGARKVVLQGCGHMPHMERPDELARVVSQFLS